jgi:hypothetical protein
MMRVIAAVALALAMGAVAAPTEVAAHGRHFHDRPIVVAPPSHRRQPYPYWYYSRPQPRFQAPPVIVAPRGRDFGAPHRFRGRHHPRPGATFEFRF